jgi:phosphate transport system substrate-binding protein
MAYTRGRCTNFDYCSIAESRRDVEVTVGEDFVCPECGKPLKAPQVKGGTTSPLVPALIGVGVLALLGGAVFLGMRMGGPAEHVVAQAPVAAPVTPPVRPAPVPAEPGGAPPKQDVAPAPAPAPAENVLLRLHGSNAMAASVVAPLAASYLAQIGDTDVTTAEQAGDLRVSGLRGGIRESIVLSGDGAGAGFAALGNGRADVVMAPRRILPAEQSSVSSLGDMTSPEAEHVLALDAIAVVVNPTNPVAALTRQQAHDLLAGKIRDWGSVGAASAPVTVYAAQAEGEAALATGLSADAAGAHRVPNDAAVSQAVAGDRQGVGLVDLASAGAARVVPIAETGSTPVSPLNHAAVVADDYPLAYRLYLYTSPKAAAGFAQRFVEYAVSPAGQAIVEQHGLISPVLTKKVEAAAPQTEAEKLRAFVKGAKRLAIVFRFQANSTVLDAFGERDLDRVTNYLVSLHDGGDHLLLAGFADNQGDAATNIEVSKKRADAVAALFLRRGLTPGGVAGFGAELPVADNGTEAGRERNRRVEVYIKP